MRIRNKNFNKKILSFFKVKSILKLKPRLLLALLFITMSVSIPLYSANAGIDFWNWDLRDAMLNSVYAVVYVLAAIALWVLSSFVMFGAWLVDVMLEPEIYAIVLNIKTGPLMIGWTVIRDFANTFFILILLLIAFSTILRIQKYSAKAFLPKFIIAIFLINFSAVIAAIIIDFGQVFMYEIYGWLGTFGGNNGAMGDLTSLVNGMVDTYGITPPPGDYSLENTTGAVFAAVFAVIMGCVYIMLAGFLLIRLVVLAILVVLSPIAFLGMIMPGLSSHSGTWWRKIFEYSLFGPIFIFFVFLASTMASELTTVTYNLPPNDLTGLSFLVAVIVPYCVSIGMLLAVIPVTKQLGIAGSSALIGGTMGIGKIGMGAIAGTKLAGGGLKKAGGGVDNRIMKGRASEWGRKQKEGILKAVPLGLGKGSALKNQAETERKKEENMKKVRVEFGEAKSRDIDLLQQKANGKLATKEDKALFAETAAAQGKMGDATYAGDIRKFMPELERTLSGKELSEITDKNLEAATSTSKNKKKIDAANSGDYRSFDTKAQDRLTRGETTGKEEIKRDIMNDLVEDGNTNKIQDFGNETTAKVYNEVVSSEQKKSDKNRMSQKQRDELSEGYMANTLSVADYGTATADQKKEDLKYKTEAVNVGKELTEAFAGGGADAAKDIAKAFSKFDSKRIAKFTEDELRAHGHATNSSQLRSINRDGKQDELKVIKESKENRINIIEGIIMLPGVHDPVIEAEKEKLEKDGGNIDSMIEGDKY